ncbi:MAG: hypothetical protein H0X67_07005 [Acidobacteria bacterium]|nr:hypothetical protein [Acidobacteriota bacterium]
MPPDLDVDSERAPREGVVQQLERVLASATFRGAERSRALLKFLVEQALAGKADRLKEYTLGAEALGRGESYDPRTDPIVRAEASRLRARLERYYTSEGSSDPVLIELPRGTYVPRFRMRAAAPEPEVSSGRPSRRRVGGLAVGVTAAIVVCSLAIAAWILVRQPGARVSSPQVFEVVLAPGEWTLASDVGSDLVLSADGSRLVFLVRASDGQTRLMTRRVDELHPAVLQGTEGARAPFLSPDGRWVGFWAAGALKKTSVDGGAPVLLCEANDLLGASWGDDGQIVASLGSGKLWRVSSSPGTPTVLADFSAAGVDPR